MRLLILGGTGFIGTNIIQNLVEYFDFVAIDIFSRAESITSIINLKVINKMEQVSYLKEIPFSKMEWALYDVIVNLADNADVGIKKSTSLNVPIEQIISSMKSDGHFIYVSSTEVYGTVLKDKIVTENDLLEPESLYAKQKVLMEEKIFALTQLFKIRSTILRPCTLYGRHQYGNKLLIKSIKLGILGEELQPENPSIVKTYLSINDFCSALCNIISKRVEGIYNVTGTEYYSNKEIVDIVLNELDFCGREEANQKLKFSRENDGHRYPVNSDRIYKKIVWEPKERLPDVLHNIIEQIRREQIFE